MRQETPEEIAKRGSRVEGMPLLPASQPLAAAERAVLNRFGDAIRPDVPRVFEVGDGPRDFQNPVVGAGGDATLVRWHVQNIPPALAERGGNRSWLP